MDESEYSAQPFYRRSAPVFETPAMQARRKQRRFLMGIVMACVAAICATRVMVGTDWSTPTPKSAASKSDHSAAWDLGYRDGRMDGQADAQRRHTSIGYGATRQEAPRRTAPRRGYGADRRDYQEGWQAGYLAVVKGQ